MTKITRFCVRLLCLKAVCSVISITAADVYGTSNEGALEPINKQVAKASFDLDARVDADMRMEALARSAPGQAIEDPLQVLLLPEPAELGAFELMVRVICSRTTYTGIYSEAEMQILSRAIEQFPQWQKNTPFHADVVRLATAFDKFYKDSGLVSDLTALDQRRRLCEYLYPLNATKGVKEFAGSAKAKQFARRQLQLKTSKAPKGVVPQPPLESNLNNGF